MEAIKKIIEELLQKKNFKYLVDGDVYEVFVGSFTCYIQTEGEDSACYFDNPDETWYQEYSTYSVDIAETIEADIDELVEFTKVKARTIQKIRGHLDEIEKLCEESGCIDYYDLVDIKITI